MAVVLNDTLAANIAVHSALADIYDRTEPHFRPENMAKVRKRLAHARQLASGSALLDIGCGTGFVIGLSRDVFSPINGIDLTRAMLDRVDTSAGEITLHEGVIEELPFDDGTFDVVTAYSVVDHLADLSVAFREVARVLKPGGVFYADLIPNRAFWTALSALPPAPYEEIVARERNMVTNNSSDIEAQHGIKAETFQDAEPGKKEGGLELSLLLDTLSDAGFRQSDVRYDWFLGQGKVMHQQSFDEATAVENYLHELGPLSSHLFKYIYFFATR